MSISTPFIERPVGTTLLTLALTLAGVLGYMFLPVSPLPQIDFPTISVGGSLPGASPETMASAVAAPLERQFGRIAGVSEMTSTSYLGMKFDLNRDPDAAARDVQAAINAARAQLPADLPNNPQYRKSNPSDGPVMILALTSEFHTMTQMYDVAATIVSQQISQVNGVGQVNVGGGSTPAVRVDVNPTVLSHYNLGMDDVRRTLGEANANRPKGQVSDNRHAWSISTTDQLMQADEYRPLIVTFRNGAPVRLGDVAEVTDSVEDVRSTGYLNGKKSITVMVASRRPTSFRRSIVWPRFCRRFRRRCPRA
jgi:multidrug efflux pump